MKLDSPIFDRIRVKQPEEQPRPAADEAVCEWKGCTAGATHRAPKGRNRENEYFRFCLDHVREYNQSYNYFAGMSDDAVLKYQKEAVIGHRPTWRMGLNGGAHTERLDPGRFYAGSGGASDPFGFFRDGGPWRPGAEQKPAAEARTLRNAERKALDTLGLDADASGPDIKARFKELVKRHHPDANGGDRSFEDKLREIIQAYNYLKSARFV
jgi:curved DNA-binding protein CbpA